MILKETSLIDISKYEASKKAIDNARMFNNPKIGDLCKLKPSGCIDMDYIPNIFSGLTSIGNLSNWNVSNPNSFFNLVY